MRVERGLTVMLAAAIGLSLHACEPCSGVMSCTTGAHVAVSGRLLDELTGAPAAGATVDLVRTGGIALESDSVSARTDGDGLFHFTLQAAEAGESTVDFVVHSPGGTTYRITGVTLRATGRRGEGQVLSPWTTVPRLPDLAFIYRRGHPRQPLVGVQVEFRQTGGPPLNGLTGGVFRTFTNGDGWMPLFGGQVAPQDAQDVVGNVVISAPAPLGLTTHTGVRIPPQTTFRAAAQLRMFGAGPSLEYHFAIQDRGRSLPVEGVRLEFTQTAGILVTQPTWSEVSGPHGRVVFPGYALERGAVQGNLRVIPPAPWKTYNLNGLSLPTFEHDTAQIFAIIGVGPGLPYYLRIRNNGVPMPGVEVDFHRTGGISVSPERFTAVTNDSGQVNLTPAPATEGDVIADITVRPPSPHPRFVVTGVRMTALDADRPGGRVLLGDWDIASPPTALRQHP